MNEKFNPKDYIMNMRGKDYLEVKWRIVWFREEHPKGCISTEITMTDPVVIKASILNEEGMLLATGFGTPKTQGVAKGRPFEGAETAAIGRALALAGYGMQFTGEEEGEHLADSPIEQKDKQENAARNWTAAQKGYLVSANYAENDFSAKAMLDKSNLPGNASKVVIESWGKYYRASRDDDNTSDVAALAANGKYEQAMKKAGK